jgi:RNase P subunit RPR2
MAIMRSDNCSPYGMACSQCNDALIAPSGSEYVSKYEVRHLWSCESCGHKIEMVVNLPINATSKRSKSVVVHSVSLVA